MNLFRSRRPETEIILHCGLHKTGTTTIQNFLREHRDAINAAGAVYLPLAGRGKWEGHHNLAYELAARERFTPDHGGWDALEAEIDEAGARRVLVSSENLSLVDPFELRRQLRKRNMTPRLIFYVRRQDDLIPSAWSQFVKTGHLLDTLEDFTTASLHEPAYQFNKLFTTWRGLFGEAAIEVRACTPEALEGGDLFTDFARRAGLPDDLIASLGPVSRAHDSPAAEIVYLMRFVAARATYLKDLQERLRRHRWLLRPFRDALAPLADEMGLRKLALPLSLRRQALAHFGGQNLAFQRGFDVGVPDSYWTALDLLEEDRELADMPVDGVRDAAAETLRVTYRGRKFGYGVLLAEALDALPLTRDGRMIDMGAVAALKFASTRRFAQPDAA